MTFCLKTKLIKPNKDIKINNAIILLHGYGGDGNDISMLSLNWKRYLPNTVFICPNGYESCSINPSGYQWFDLSKEDPKYILEESKKAEIILNKFINEIKKEFDLRNKNICLSGFSQGCMMAINLGLNSKENYNCIIGFSGKIIDQNYLKDKMNNSSNILLIHGDADEIVSPNYMLEAKDFFIRNNVKIETHLIKNCGHHIPIEASSIALNYILKKINSS
tara:strand:- start:2245 stop:2904 length:660 start_codon:yes stop_codon:yes gene_type:complete